MQSRYPTFSMIVSFLQKFCADQSPTSYVVEVQSKAENDWLITLSKKGPSPINPPTHFFYEICPFLFIRQKDKRQ